jgi:catechol 2,3-dioxygenase-like lactoylglutathione lyase family enzyme
MKEEINYLTVRVHSLAAALNFYKDELGLVPNNVILNITKPYAVLTDKEHTDLLLIEDRDISSNPRIILNTDDCLKSYHELKEYGISFSQHPDYTSFGLVAEFTDPFGNECALIEKRDYDLKKIL